MAELIADALRLIIPPDISGEFRPGEMRYLISNIGRIQAVGYMPDVDLATGIGRYLTWTTQQGDIRNYVAAVETILRCKPIVQRRAAHWCRSKLDTGQGIAPNDVPHVFERAFRGDRSRLHDHGSGAGLRLAIAYGLVEAHGGTIGAESEWGRGTRFFFTLRRA